ncbi:3-dehydroshikimate dehydratase, putative [Talaromyces stipitatus ATCC 10500]|uniref:3-dehydroshikimate dehydratase, putative n=1 Tax=Talaromyces stipitatus (strain ATCC 10500 / CBS 375.48 / QM 6759 / NRRL 1006) TaxID=441959 RepID=B8M074_TALSN|nr:3-dehydroshikimate dehydratase, putative [Talaromyces stipitatus ATCC 10500]EED21171.1 3-dehydroshikimate dehydratase, putative [Talaromyces stipitatus ATCC 10500]
MAKSPRITLSSLRKIPLSFASCSIGKTTDSLTQRLEAISSAGFTAIELSFPDIKQYAEQLLNKQVRRDDYPDLCRAAQEIGKLCQQLGLEIMMLQPFANFEGWPKGSREREEAFTRAKKWIELMKACGADLLQVGSTDSSDDRITTDRSEIVKDLQELADMLAKENFCLAYEDWCWSTHAPTWKDVWEIVHQVDRPNVGLCLDTFQIAGSEWADPATASGLIEEIPKSEVEKRWKASMEELASSVPAEKIYLLQISDAYKPTTPIERKIKNGLLPRGQWSHDFRPMPYEGGYLPIEDVTKAVLRTGFRGYFSMEIFDNGPDGTGKEYNVGKFAKSAMENMQRLFKNVADTST